MDRILDSGSNDWGSTPHGDTIRQKLHYNEFLPFYLNQLQEYRYIQDIISL